MRGVRGRGDGDGGGGGDGDGGGKARGGRAKVAAHTEAILRVDAKIKAAEADLEALRTRKKGLETQAAAELDAASMRRREKERVPAALTL